MPDGRKPLTVKVVDKIADVPAAAWDSLVDSDSPFANHAFLHALEASGSATAETGWLPQHLVAEDSEGRLVGAVPMYLKSHSYGEYVFDHSWAAAYERAGGSYYPKLQIAVPFTPVTGPRLLVQQGPRAAAIEDALLETMISVASRLGVSSLHVTFAAEAQARRLAASGWLLRTGYQFHWHNQGYVDFEDFLASLASRKRKSVRKERREVEVQDIEIQTLTGEQLEPRHWEAFHRFYLKTSEGKWGHPYLTSEFFQLLGTTMPEKVVLVMAKNRDRFVAGALNLLGTETLYGRNWGSLGDYKFLHFEACYYRAIDFAIAHGLKRVEAGAQGEHKIQRGYLPTPTYSVHWFRDSRFHDALADFLNKERAAIAAQIAELSAQSPYRRDDAPGAEGAGG
ncbi:MAG: N-acetyltransferase [Rhodospirillaceae bacterium]|nr:N-acetyltransferase [Rhodospirillaceae bacterium]